MAKVMEKACETSEGRTAAKTEDERELSDIHSSMTMRLNVVRVRRQALEAAEMKLIGLLMESQKKLGEIGRLRADVDYDNTVPLATLLFALHVEVHDEEARWSTQYPCHK
ncbi:hypothetical protein R1sor_017700 [Riccia sorocarpa]|uniref:Uncharacterized protein n=1 Tax=Riccia sorocarpa TaxID=122646 RepID=A0ABD3I7N3_9MARC